MTGKGYCPPVAVGQRWLSLYERRHGEQGTPDRVLRVIEVGPERAKCRVEGTDRIVSIRVDRFKPGSSGYEYLGMTTGQITFLMRPEKNGTHTHLRVFVGGSGTDKAFAGMLTLYPDEAEALVKLVMDGVKPGGNVTAEKEE